MLKTKKQVELLDLEIIELKLKLSNVTEKRSYLLRKIQHLFRY